MERGNASVTFVLQRGMMSFIGVSEESTASWMLESLTKEGNGESRSRPEESISAWKSLSLATGTGVCAIGGIPTSRNAGGRTSVDEDKTLAVEAVGVRDSKTGSVIKGVSTVEEGKTSKITSGGDSILDARIEPIIIGVDVFGIQPRRGSFTDGAEDTSVMTDAGYSSMVCLISSCSWVEANFLILMNCNGPGASWSVGRSTADEAVESIVEIAVAAAS